MLKVLLMSAVCIFCTPILATAEEVPQGFVVQRLAETDGRVWRPKDWYFASEGTPSGWMWTISKEDPSTGPYRTGMRIQLLAGITSNGRKTPEVFAKDFIQEKMGTSEVLRKCGIEDLGDFYRQCLEVLEEFPKPIAPGKYHVLYSVFWGKNLDMVVVSTFGAPASTWTEIAPVVDTMSKIELIGPNLGK